MGLSLEWNPDAGIVNLKAQTNGGFASGFRPVDLP